MTLVSVQSSQGKEVWAERDFNLPGKWNFFSLDMYSITYCWRQSKKSFLWKWTLVFILTDTLCIKCFYLNIWDFIDKLSAVSIMQWRFYREYMAINSFAAKLFWVFWNHDIFLDLVFMISYIFSYFKSRHF